MSEFEFKDHDGASKASTEKRLRLLQEYIKALTVKPNGPQEVLFAVGFDLIYVSEKYGGNLSRAAGRAEKRAARSRVQDEAAPS